VPGVHRGQVHHGSLKPLTGEATTALRGRVAPVAPLVERPLVAGDDGPDSDRLDHGLEAGLDPPLSLVEQTDDLLIGQFFFDLARAVPVLGEDELVELEYRS
jgi:hypothetical protein